MAGILDGVAPIIDEILGCSACTRSGYLELDTSGLDGVALVERPYRQICRNLDGRSVERNGSQENWRWQKQLHLSENNGSPEKRLEKAIARVTGDDWVNQVPTASGVMGSGERHRNIDLARRVEAGRYEFIELKVASDNPLYAATEILCYGLIYLCSREYGSTLGYGAHHSLLRAAHVELKVLAPLSFYGDLGRPAELSRLQEKLQSGLQELAAGRCARLRLEVGFEFAAFPDECRWEMDEEVHDLLQRRFPLC
jgi:hypothetical protein